MLSTMMWMSLLNSFFFRSPTVMVNEIYLGALIFAGFILYDTQLIIERAERGSRDYIGHSVDLFLDGIALFSRLLVILMRRETDRDKRDKRRRNNDD